MADEYGMRYIEVSSSTRHNINVLFEILIIKRYNYDILKTSNKSLSIHKKVIA